MQNFSTEAKWHVPPASERGGKLGSNEWFMFRSRMNVFDSSRGVLRIAADSKYWLYVNGKLVVREGGLKRGPVPDGSYYDEVDISDLLMVGGNTIAILLCYFGRHGFSHRDSGVPGLLVDADSARFSAWKVIKHPAYFDAGYVSDAFRLSENSVGFDARYDLTGWSASDFDDSNWPEALLSGAPSDQPWGPLEKREFLQWFWSELKSYESVEARPCASDGGYACYHCKLPHNAHFVPVLTVEAKAGICIDVTVTQDTNCFRMSYITIDGEQSYESIGWMNGEEVVYKVPNDAIRVIGFFYRETSYPSEFVGSFSCDEVLLNRLWKKARRTLLVNMRDNFMDCPCRERAQWPGDLIVQLGQVPYCLGREADLLVKKGLRETLRWQREDGIIYGPVPEGNWRMELPAQMLAVVSPYGIWTYYMNTADFQTLEELYPFAKRYLDIWEFQKNGLIKYRPDEKGSVPVTVDGVSVGTWDWIDWGERIDAEPVLNAWFVLAAQGVRQMAEELGLDQDAREIGRKENQVRSAIRKQYWNASRGGYVSAGFEFDPDDRVQALMVLSGAATPDQYPQLKIIFEKVEQACPYMEKYVLEALFKMGEPELALSRMKSRYASMASNNCSTLWERWPNGAEHPGTVNHAWSGGPLTLLSSVVAGISPLEPGWKRFSICPTPGALNEISALVGIPQGVISMKAQKDSSGWVIEVCVPEGTVAAADFSSLGTNCAPIEIQPGTQIFRVGSDKVFAEACLHADSRNARR